MCCGFGARLHSRQNIFRPHLSEFSGSTPDRLLLLLLLLLLSDLVYNPTRTKGYRLDLHPNSHIPTLQENMTSSMGNLNLERKRWVTEIKGNRKSYLNYISLQKNLYCTYYRLCGTQLQKS